MEAVVANAGDKKNYSAVKWVLLDTFLFLFYFSDYLNSNFSMDNKVFKTVMVGGSGSGKTSLRNYYMHKQYNHQHVPTTTPDFFSTYVTLDSGELLALQIWDTTEHDTKGAMITNSLLEDAEGLLLVVDSTNRDSLSSLQKYLDKLVDINQRRPPGRSIQVVVAQTKADLPKQLVSCQEVKQLCQRKLKIDDFEYIETSVNTGKGVAQAFQTIAKICYDQCQGQNSTAASDNEPKKSTMRRARTSKHGDPIIPYHQFEIAEGEGGTMTGRSAQKDSERKSRVRQKIRWLLCLPY